MFVSAWLQERADLCRALLYAVVLSPRQLKPSSLADVLSLLEQLVGQVKAAGRTARLERAALCSQCEGRRYSRSWYLIGPVKQWCSCRAWRRSIRVRWCCSFFVQQGPALPLA